MSIFSEAYTGSYGLGDNQGYRHSSQFTAEDIQMDNLSLGSLFCWQNSIAKLVVLAEVGMM